MADDTLPPPCGYAYSYYVEGGHVEWAFDPATTAWGWRTGDEALLRGLRSREPVHDEDTVRRLLAAKDERIRVLSEALRLARAAIPHGRPGSIYANACDAADEALENRNG